MMTALLQSGYGGPEALRVGQVPRPMAGQGQVLVRVAAASVNARDWHLMRGDPWVARLLGGGDLGLRRPAVATRGTDFAGTVVAVGPDVTSLAIGDEVFGEAAGAFAEFVLAPASVVASKPANLSFAEAAALPLAANTALIGIREEAGVRRGQHVLVNGASGGVGLFAVQLAHADGAEVTAVCSARNAELARAAGADHVVDYAREDFTHVGGRYDVVLDLVGNRRLRHLLRAVAPGGTLVLSGGGVWTGGSFGGPMGLLLTGMLARPFVRARVRQLVAVPNPARLATLRELAESGVLRPVIDRTYAMRQAAEAIHYLEVEHARAKVVLVA
jgi:NADPH:quinone reductase-like Zn-dependent oxidoreductase